MQNDQIIKFQILIIFKKIFKKYPNFDLKPKGQMNNNSVGQEIQNLDRQIETLMKCKPLPENEVKILCEKVCNFSINLDNKIK